MSCETVTVIFLQKSDQKECISSHLTTIPCFYLCRPMDSGPKEKSLLSKQKRRGKPIMFDESQYTDFMSNIHKRKQERKRFGQALQRKKDRAALLASRKEGRKALKNAIAEHFGEITVDDDGSITYTKMPYQTEDIGAAAEQEESEESEEDEDEDADDLRFEDDNALIVVETTDMKGNKVAQKANAARKMSVSDIMSATAEDDEDDEEDEEDEENEEEEEEEESEDDAVARSNRMMDLVRKFGGSISDDEYMDDESEEEIVIKSSNPNKTKIVKKEEVKPQKPVKETKQKSVQQDKKETKIEKKEIDKVVEPKKEEKKEAKKAEKEVKKVEKEVKKDTKKETKKETKTSAALAKEKEMYNNLLKEKDDDAEALVPITSTTSYGPARPTLEDALFSLPKPTHWEAEKYRKAAMAEAQAIDSKDKGKKKSHKDDDWEDLKRDTTYGWNEGEGSTVKDFGLINGMPPACMGGRHRKKPLSKKKDNSHNARKERKRAREKDDEDKKMKAAFEDGQSMNHGFGYDSDDEEDLLLLGKHNKKRKVIEAKRKSKTSAMQREGLSRKAYYFGSKDNTVSF